HRAAAGRVQPAHRHGGQLGAGGQQRALQDVQAGRAAGAHDQPGAERLAGDAQRVLHRGQPPCTAVSTSTRSPAPSRTPDQAPRGTTSPLTATATPAPAPVRLATSPATVVPGATSLGSPFKTMVVPVLTSGPPGGVKRSTVNGPATSASSPVARYPVTASAVTGAGSIPLP